MSATLDASKFADYFKRDGGAGAPALHIPGFTHPVKDVYLEECLQITGQLIGRGSPFALGREAFLQRKKALEEGAQKGGVVGMGAADWRRARGVGGDEDDDGKWDAEEEGVGEGIEDPGDGGGGGGGGKLDSVQISMLNVDESKINYELIEMMMHHICSAPEHQAHILNILKSALYGASCTKCSGNTNFREFLSGASGG
jgi:ATP-dependent RNA helicase DHX57